MNTREIVKEKWLDEYLRYAKSKMAMQKKNTKRIYLITFISAIIGSLIGGLGTPVLIHCLEADGYEKYVTLFLFIGLTWFIISFLLHIIIHEAGHLVFGLITGYRFLSFRIFSFVIVKRDKKLSAKRLKMVGTAGQCLMYPPKWENDKPYPYVLYNLGGGLLNIFFGLLTVPFFFCGNEVLAWIGSVFSVSAVIMAASNLIPLSSPMPNDGKNCLMCKKSAENKKSLYIQLLINAELSDGKSIQELDTELFSLSENANLSNTLTAVIRILEVYRHLILEEYETAKQCLDSFSAFEDKMPTVLINMLYINRLYLLIHERAPLPQIASVVKVVDAVLRTNVSDLSVLRVKYAYASLLSEEEREQIEWLIHVKKDKLPKIIDGYRPLIADKIYTMAEKLAKNHPVVGEARLHMELIERDRESSYSLYPERQNSES